MESHERPRLQVAVVGGGIIGIMTALGLLKRNIDVKIYEQSRSFREIGAGVAFSPSAVHSMELLDTRIADVINLVGTRSGIDEEGDDLRWYDGYNWDPKDPEGTENKLLYSVNTGQMGFYGCHRAQLVDELVKLLPSGAVELGKRFANYEDTESEAKLRIRFEDGSTAEADAVIGCDGIKSKVRQSLLGADSPAAYPHFTHFVVYRDLIPMDRAVSVLGSYKARNPHIHIGPDAHILHFPVARGEMFNIVAFAKQEEGWPLGDANGIGNMTAPATRDEVAAAFKGWCPTVTKVIGLMSNNLSKWALFDMYDHPAPTYSKGRVCLAGDAAHASTPHHGAGAAIGVEDALALCTLLEKAQETLSSGNHRGIAATMESAFSVYDANRRPRSQWQVKSSRETGEIYHWNHPDTGTDWDKCAAEITERSHKLWFFDTEAMVNDLDREFKKAML